MTELVQARDSPNLLKLPRVLWFAVASLAIVIPRSPSSIPLAAGPAARGNVCAFCSIAVRRFHFSFFAQPSLIDSALLAIEMPTDDRSVDVSKPFSIGAKCHGNRHLPNGLNRPPSPRTRRGVFPSAEPGHSEEPAAPRASGTGNWGWQLHVTSWRQLPASDLPAAHEFSATRVALSRSRMKRLVFWPALLSSRATRDICGQNVA